MASIVIVVVVVAVLAVVVVVVVASGHKLMLQTRVVSLSENGSRVKVV